MKPASNGQVDPRRRAAQAAYDARKSVAFEEYVDKHYYLPEHCNGDGTHEQAEMMHYFGSLYSCFYCGAKNRTPRRNPLVHG